MPYEQNMEAGFSEARTQQFVDWVGAGKRVLDLGCWDGRDSEELLRHGNHVTGVEILDASAEKARQRGIEVVQFDLTTERWPLPLASYDVVIAAEIIEHVLDTDAFLENIRRHLRPDGQLIVTTPNVASLGRRLMLLLGRNPFLEFSLDDEINGYPAVGHIRYFTRDNLHRLLEAHGFDDVDYASDGLNVGPVKSIRLGRLFPTLAWRFVVRCTLLESTASGT